MTVSGAWPAKEGFAYVSGESGRPQPWFQTWAGGRRMLPIDGAVVRLAWRPDETRLLVVADLTGREDYRLAVLDRESTVLPGQPSARVCDQRA